MCDTFFPALRVDLAMPGNRGRHESVFGLTVVSTLHEGASSINIEGDHVDKNL